MMENEFDSPIQMEDDTMELEPNECKEDHVEQCVCERASRSDHWTEEDFYKVVCSNCAGNMVNDRDDWNFWRVLCLCEYCREAVACTKCGPYLYKFYIEELTKSKNGSGYTFNG